MRVMGDAVRENCFKTEPAPARVSWRKYIFVWALAFVGLALAPRCSGPSPAPAVHRSYGWQCNPYNGTMDIGSWYKQELFILREAKNSGKILDQIYAKPRKSKKS